METPRKFTEESLKKILEALDESAVYGTILRAKGIVDASDGDWLYFDTPPANTTCAAAMPPSPAVSA